MEKSILYSIFAVNLDEINIRHKCVFEIGIFFANSLLVIYIQNIKTTI